MATDVNGIVVSGLAIALFVAVLRRVWPGMRGRRRRQSMSPGSGAAGTIYDMLNEDKRKAVEIIVEEKAEARRPEYPDGNLPDLEDPKKP
jgi:hypothetical protein